MKQEFLIAFRINRMVIFEVNYYTLYANEKPYFETSANEFIRSKRDWSICGQAQEHVLPKNSLAYKFYQKWDAYHLKDLTQQQYDEMVQDLNELKKHYRFIYKELDETKKPYNPNITFTQMKILSIEC